MGWIVSSLHIKIIRRREQKTLRRASSKEISILEGEGLWPPQTSRNRRYSVLWICRPPSEWCWLPPRGCSPFSQNLCLLGTLVTSDTATQTQLLPRTAHAPAQHCLSRTCVSCPAPHSDEIPHLEVIQLCCLPCQVWVTHQTWLLFHAVWVVSGTNREEHQTLTCSEKEKEIKC